MATILITGGTGMIGKTLTGFLIANSHKVIVLSRSDLLPKDSSQITYCKWNIEEGKIDKEAIANADYVVHLAGAVVVDKPWTKAYKKEILDSRIQSSTLLIKALQEIPNNIKAVVGASAIGWYGADSIPLIRPAGFIETDNADEVNFLGVVCKKWEHSLASVETLGIRLVKFRIGIVLSNTGGALPAFKKPIKWGVAAILGSGKQIISWIHIDDLCAMIFFALQEEKIKGVYNATAPQFCNNKSLIKELARQIKGNKFITLPVPASILKLMMGKRSLEVLKSTTVCSDKIQLSGFKFMHRNIAEALSNLINSKNH